MKQIWLDQLTGLGNEKYLIDNYKNYLIEHPDSRLIMMDLRKFKNINDEFGHKVGDQTLMFFSDLLNKVFKGAIVVRLHGDEFAIMTTLSTNEIEKNFVKVNERIKSAYEAKVLPLYFNFNAGDCKCKLNFYDTLEIADYMMYYAKNHELSYQPFNKYIYSLKVGRELFLSEFEKTLLSENFTYSTRNIFDADGNETDIEQIYTRSTTGDKFLSNGNYDVLSGQSSVVELDIANLKLFKEMVQTTDGRKILLLNYKSLLHIESIVSILANLKVEDLSKLILGIDIKNIEFRDRDTVIDSINILKNLQCVILLDKFTSVNGDYIWENTSCDFVRIDADYWKASRDDAKKRHVLASKLEMITSYIESCITLFDKIDTKAEYDYLTDIATEDTLYSGNHLSNEKTLEISKGIEM